MGGETPIIFSVDVQALPADWQCGFIDFPIFFALGMVGLKVSTLGQQIRKKLVFCALNLSRARLNTQ